MLYSTSTRDPLSGVASVIAVIQIAGTVVNICYEYRSGVRVTPKTITQLIDEVDRLDDVVKKLDLILVRRAHVWLEAPCHSG